MQPNDIMQMDHPFAIEGILNSRPSRQGLKELNALARQGIRCYPKRPLSYSSLKEFKKSPLSYIEYVTKPWTFTTATSHGKLFEDLLFSRDPKERFVIFEKPEPNKDFRIKANKEGEYSEKCVKALGMELIKIQ